MFLIAGVAPNRSLLPLSFSFALLQRFFMRLPHYFTFYFIFIILLVLYQRFFKFSSSSRRKIVQGYLITKDIYIPCGIKSDEFFPRGILH